MNIKKRLDQLDPTSLNPNSFELFYSFIYDASKYINELSKPDEDCSEPKGTEDLLPILSIKLIDLTKSDHDKLLAIYEPLINYGSPFTNTYVLLVTALENILRPTKSKKDNRKMGVLPQDEEMQILSMEINNHTDHPSTSLDENLTYIAEETSIKNLFIYNINAYDYFVDLIKKGYEYKSENDNYKKKCGIELINLAMGLKNLIHRKKLDIAYTVNELDFDIKENISKCTSQILLTLKTAQKAAEKLHRPTDSLFFAMNYEPDAVIITGILDQLKNKLISSCTSITKQDHPKTTSPTPKIFPTMFTVQRL